MKQRNHALWKRLSAWAGALLAAVLCAAPALAAPEIDTSTAVNDYAGILSEETEAYVENITIALQDTCGAQIGVYTVEYIGNSTMEGYAYDVLNAWGLGSADQDNGVLLLLAPGEDDYYVTRGSGLETQLSVSTLGTILDESLEPYWVEQDYDTGTQQTVRAIAERLCSIYGIPTSTLDNAGQAAAADSPEGGVNIMAVLLVIFAVILVIVLIASLTRPRGGYGGPVWFTPIWRPRRPRRPPPPPPGGGFDGPRGGPRPGGGMGGAPRGGSRPSSGGFRPGGGMGGMGGAGRGGSRPSSGGSRSSGGFRAGGGSSRGGGVGRRR